MSRRAAFVKLTSPHEGLNQKVNLPVLQLRPQIRRNFYHKIQFNLVKTPFFNKLSNAYLHTFSSVSTCPLIRRLLMQTNCFNTGDHKKKKKKGRNAPKKTKPQKAITHCNSG